MRVLAHAWSAPGGCTVLITINDARLLIVTGLDHGDIDAAAENAKQRLLADLATPRLRDAVALYFDPEQPFAGHTFDSLGQNPPNKITSDDLLAVTLLNVRWTPPAVSMGNSPVDRRGEAHG